MHFVFAFLLLVAGVGAGEGNILETGMTDGKPSWCQEVKFGASQSDKDTCGW